MSYEQFVQKIEQQLQTSIGHAGRIYVHTVTKINGRQRKGITFVETGINISPTIYLEEYYERFQRGSTVEKITEQILELYEQVKFRHSWEGDFVQKYENIQDHIVYQVINREANRELLKEIPYVPYLDLAVIFYVLIELEEKENKIATMLIRNEHLKWWDKTKDDIYKMAHKNTERLLPSEFSTMYSVIEDLLEEAGESEREQDDMYILTNISRNFGAAAMLYENRLQRIGEYLKENFYVLPSSVHEVIIIKESNAPCKKDLCGIVTEINETQVKEEEVLSNTAYYYDRKAGTLML